MLVYLDDTFCISHVPRLPIKEISYQFSFKKDKVALPEVYLGARLEEKIFNALKIWNIFSREYIGEAIKLLERQLEKQ